MVKGALQMVRSETADVLPASRDTGGLTPGVNSGAEGTSSENLPTDPSLKKRSLGTAANLSVCGLHTSRRSGASRLKTGENRLSNGLLKEHPGQNAGTPHG